MRWLLLVLAVAVTVAMAMIAWLAPTRFDASPTVQWIAAGDWIAVLASILAIFIVAMPLLFSVINQLVTEKTKDVAEDARREVSRNGLLLGWVFIGAIVSSCASELIFGSLALPWTTALQVSAIVLFGLVLIDTIQTIIGLRTEFRP